MPSLDEIDPVIRELFKALPEAGTVGAVDQQKLWLTAMSAAIDMAYPLPQDDPPTIEGLGL